MSNVLLNRLSYGAAYVFALLAVAGLWLGGAWTFTVVVAMFVATPVLDAVIPPDEVNPSERGTRSNWGLDGWLWMWPPLQVGLLAFTLADLLSGGRTPLEWVGLTVSSGVLCGGLGITIAHELMHRRGRFERAMAEVLMSTVSYTHFCVEHVLGHHRNVATPNDPASARVGDDIFSYLPRTIVGGVISAWRLEGRRVRSKGIRAASLRDRRLRYPLQLVAVYAVLFVTTGVAGVMFFAAQSLVAVVLLEVVNYVEHYGLARREIAPGKYERVLPEHSWNSPHRLTGRLLFNLPRHSDHHHVASRTYGTLRHIPDSPQLPAGYATMVLLALVPPLWWRVMNPRVEAFNARDRPIDDDEAVARAA